jgi:hypothetical protein
MSSDYIQEDIRLINLYSQTATTYLNGALKSNVSFNFKNILRDEPDIIYSTIGISSAQIPVSYFTINEYNNILSTGLGDITITRGNYNASTLRAELTTRLVAVGITGMVVTINSSTGKLIFTSSIPFTFLSSSALDILGFDNLTYTSVANVINAPYLLNLLGIQQLRINSSALSCSNSNSTQMGESNLIGVVQSTAPPFGMILYANQTSYSVLRSKNISLIDIQVLDENSNYVDFNNIDWTITLQLTTYRRIPLPSNSKDYLVPILATLTTIQSTLQSGANPNDNLAPPLEGGLLTQENQQQQDLLNDDSNSLDIMSYNKQLPS